MREGTKPFGIGDATTRRAPPSLGAEVVERPRLVQLLRRPARVTLAVAPPGFGKTTAVAQWAATCPDPLAWVAVDLLEDAPATCWRHIVDAVRTVAPSVDGEPRRVLDQDPQSNHFLNVLIAQLDQADHRSVLVLDGVPADVGRAVTDGLALITERVGEQLQLVITTRVDPPLPLARWRTRGWVTELREVDLRFSGPEALDVAATFDRLRVPDVVVEGVNERVDGWPIALHLALVSAPEHGDPEPWTHSIAASPGVLGDFVVTEILDNLPAAEREVIFDLSVVDWFDGELAVELAGSGAGAALVELRRRRLLLSDVDAPSPGMRFHPLLRELVAAELRWRDPARYVARHRQAAELWHRRGLITLAYRHLVDVGDVERSNELVVTSLIEAGDHAVAAWTSTAAAAADDPNLAIDLAFAAFINRDQALTHTWIARAETLVCLGADAATAMRLHSVRALLALMEGRLTDAAEWVSAFDALSPGSPERRDERGRLATVAVRLALQAGRADDASRWSGWLPSWGSSTVDQLTGPLFHAWTALLQGRLREARTVIASLCERAAESGLRRHHVVIDAHVTAASVHVALGDLDAAEEWATVACADATHIGWVWHRVRSLAVAATVVMLQGRPREAIALIDEGAVDLDRSVELVEELDLVAATAWHHAGEHARATAVLATLGDRPAVRVVRASIELETDRTTSAAAALEGSENWSGEERLQARTMLAVAVGRTGELRTVVTEAAAAGWIGPFLLLGPRTRARLRSLPLADLHPGLAAQLADEAPPPTARPPLVEPLTARERSILELLPTHLSYRQIAERLGLSVNTVKSNLKAIYRKLAVTTRSDAVETGRKAGLV